MQELSLAYGKFNFEKRVVRIYYCLIVSLQIIRYSPQVIQKQKVLKQLTLSTYLFFADVT